MAAKKFEREMMAKVEALGGAEFVEDYIGDGGTVKSLSEEIGCSRTFLSRILNKRDEYKMALENGRRAQADNYAEQSLEIVDKLAEQGDFKSEHVALAKERIATRKWIATLNNPDRFAPKEKGVTINVANLHLDALKKVTAELKDVTPKAQEIEYDSGDE